MRKRNADVAVKLGILDEQNVGAPFAIDRLHVTKPKVIELPLNVGVTGLALLYVASHCT